MLKTPTETWDDFMTFSKVYIEIGDADPTYPVLRKVCDTLSMNTEQRVEFCFWYMAWYNMASALEAYLGNGNNCLEMIPAWDRLPIKLERRGLRVKGNLNNHWISQTTEVSKAGGWMNWVKKGGWKCPGDYDAERFNWISLTQTIQQVWNNGRWAAYKGCELLEKVCGLHLKAPDMGHADSSNPRKALSLLFSGLPNQEDNSKAAIQHLDGVSLDLMDSAERRDICLDGDIALLETCLCGFYSLHRGDYYLGCDIDLMLEVAMKAPTNVRDIILDARKGVFSEEYLGEVQGWKEHDKPRLRIYKETGDIVVR